MYRLQNVTKRFGPQVALEPLNLDIQPGSRTVLIGPSGCGKSTLLRLLVGLIEPDGGEIWFDGERFGGKNLREIRRRIGYVIQDGGLFPHLTARQNVTLLPRHLGWTGQRMRDRLDELTALTRLDAAMLDRFPAELSGGQRQRVSLMRALVLNPRVLLLDEPLGALDPMVRFDLQNDLTAIFAELKTTVILVTHDLAEAAFLADRLLLLKDGRVVQDAPPGELLNHPADEFAARFVRAQRPLGFETMGQLPVTRRASGSGAA